MNKKLIILLFLGFLFRLFLASLTYDGLTYDVGYYVILAKRILAGELVADCCGKNAGYPFFLAIVGFIFGIDNLWALRIIQIITDLITAIIIFILARRIFENQKAAFISFILYLFNPFTSAYTGLRLPETVSIFLVTLTLVIITAKSFTKNFFLWFALGAILGVTLFIRLQFYYFVFIMIFMLSFLYFRRGKRIYFIFFTLLSFFIFSLYSIPANYFTYQKIRLTPPYNRAWSLLYMNFYDYEYPELFIEEKNIHPELKKIMQEYFSASLTRNEREVEELNDKYRMLFWKKLKTTSVNFLINYNKNILRIWDKTHMAAYIDPYYPADKWILRAVNVTSLLLFLTGIYGYIRKQKGKIINSPLIMYTLLFFLYITFLFPLLTNESRHSLIYYSLIYFWAGYGFLLIYNYVFKKR